MPSPLPLILVFNKQRDLALSSLLVKKVMRALLKREGVLTDEISLYFLSKKKISALHQLFFSDPSPTDCITLPLDQPLNSAPKKETYHILGEIFICPKVAIEFVDATKKSTYYKEVRLYLIHTLLHLLGYRDDSSREKQRMRTKEKQLEHFLDKEGLYLEKKPLSPYNQ